MFCQPFFYFVIFIFGLIVGSFLNCVIYRLQTDESFLKGRPRRKAFSFLRGRSFCPNCRHILSWQDLIPILSFLLLKGKCRYCRQKISFQYPLVELATGIIFLLIFLLLNNYPMVQVIRSLYLGTMSCFLIVIFVYDFKHYLIPDKVIYPAIAIAFLYNIFYSFFLIHNSKFLIYSLFSAFGAAVFFLLIVLISRGKWMGIGDIKLAFFMGLFLSFPKILVALFSAFFIGAIIGIGLIIAGKKTMKSEVPFGPFLVTGTLLALFLGEQIITWYLTLFLV